MMASSITMDMMFHNLVLNYVCHSAGLLFSSVDHSGIV
jgi:hypothetical protein